MRMTNIQRRGNERVGGARVYAGGERREQDVMIVPTLMTWQEGGSVTLAVRKAAKLLIF